MTTRASLRLVRRARRVPAGLALFLALGPASGCADGSSTSATGPGGATATDTTSAPLEIAFLRINDDPTSPDLFRMAADGRGSRRVAALPGGETRPTWSVDGRRFAFVRPDESSTLGTLWVMNADGSGLRQLVADSLFQVAAASWSPDGTQLALNGLNPSNRERIGVIAVDGTSFRWMQGTGYIPLSEAPSWSPDGRFIVYEHSVGLGRSHVYKSPVAGGAPVDLTPNDADAESPMWRRVADSTN